jgi:polyisoprenoid-binding protein YceI
MKSLSLLSAFICVILFASFTAIKPHSDVYKLNTDSSSMEWYAEKVTGKHNGTIHFSSGEFTNNHGNYEGNFVVDMGSIANKDIESAEYKMKLENHLKSADFFDVAKYPKATFVLKSLTQLPEIHDGYTHAAKGMLTIKDKTNEETFYLTMRMQGNFIFASGEGIIDRSKYDVKYGSKSFFEDIGDKAIYDNFTLKFGVVAAKQ